MEDNPLYENLRLAGEVLAFDYSFVRCTRFDASWECLLQALRSEEPTIRLLSLQLVSMASKSIFRTMVSAEHRQKLVMLLTDMIAAEESWSNKCAAARILGECVSFMRHPDFPRGVRRFSFNILLQQFVKVWPANLGEILKEDPDAFDLSHYQPSAAVNPRIHMLHALSYFLSCPEGEVPTFMDYIDRLFVAILRPNVNIYLQAIVVHALHAHLPTTNMNRARVERFFRRPIYDLMHSADSIADADEITMENQAPPLHPALTKEIAAFWSVWYPKPSDEQLINIAPSPEQMSRIAEGYASKRWTWLVSKMFQAKGGAGFDLRMDSVGKLEALRRGRRNGYLLPPGSITMLQPRLYDVEKGGGFSPTSAALEVEEENFYQDIDSEFVIPDLFVLSFNLLPSAVVFNRHPLRRNIFLQNKSSTQDVSFCLQVTPTKYFSAWPTTGILTKGESTAITIQFTPSPHLTRRSPEVTGYIRVRNADGLPMERVALKGYNMPAFKAVPESLDFGFCPKDDSRTLLFMVTNLLPIECPVVMIIVPSATSSMFHIPSTQVVLPPKERKAFLIKFDPSAETIAKDELILVAYGGEITKIPLNATCGHSLRILERRLDFGPTDIYYTSVVKKLTLTNRDDKRSLPVDFECSTDEVLVNDGMPVMLEPLQELHVPIEFLSALTGTRTESLVVRAPSSAPVAVELAAFSGPAITIPVLEDVFFRVTAVSTASTVQLPIVNISSGNVLCLVTIPSGSPFTFRLMDPDFANRKLSAAPLLLEIKPYEGPESVGIHLTMGPRLTAIIEISFLSPTWGSYRCPMTIQMVKPRKWNVTTLNLVAIAINDVCLAREKPIKTFRKFMSNPAGEAPTGALLKRTDSRAEGLKGKTSEVFELEPALQTVFGASLSAKYEDVYEVVTLTNASGTTQTYHIMLSEHFTTEIPLDGEIEGLMSIEIPVRLNSKYFDRFTPNESKESIAIGSLTVFDENEREMGMKSIALHGLMGGLVSVEAREGCENLKFPSVKLTEKATRRIIIRNRAPFDVSWEGRISAIGASGTGLQADGIPMIVPTSSSAAEWCPFVLSTARVSLKPYEWYGIDITFQAMSNGEFRARLFMEYIDSVGHIVNHEHVRGKVKRRMRTINVCCQVGTYDLILSPDSFNFGDIPVFGNISRTLTIFNNQALDTPISIMCKTPFRVMKNWYLVEKQSKLDIQVLFEPLRSSSYYEILSICYGGVTKVIPLFGSGGKSLFTTNLAIPQRLELPTKGVSEKYSAFSSGSADPLVVPFEENIIDFGIVSMSTPKIKIFYLRNIGTFDFSVKSITLSEDQHLSWKFIEDNFEHDPLTQVDQPDFGSETLKQIEIDWDEGQPSSREDTPAEGSGSSGTLLRRRRAKTGSAAMGSTHSQVHKAFPFRLPPMQSVGMLLSYGTFGGFDKGEFNSNMRIEIERTTGEVDSYMMWAKGNIQPPLQIWDKKVEFGIQAVHIRQKSDVKFTNTGTVALSWSLSHDRTKYVPVSKFDPPPIPSNEQSITSPFALFPTSGKLLPGCTQSIDLTFTPSVAQYEVFGYLTLRTEDFSEAPIVVHGIGASSQPVVDKQTLTFGVLRVGTKRQFSIKLRNRGILSLRYFVEIGSNQFSADPEQGLLEGDGIVEVAVKFAPTSVGTHRSYLRVLPQSADDYGLEPLKVELTGEGSYPEVVVLTRVIDFGMALYMTPNVRPIKVQNKGAAEGHIVFSCHHPAIRLEDGQSGKAIILGPHSVKEINIIYTPQVVEYLDIKIFLRSSDSRGDYFMVALKASVGVPKLTLDPPDILDDLDFGVCSVNETMTKTFTMKNEGNISLNFCLSIDNLIKDLTDDQIAARASMVNRAPVIIDPVMGALDIGEMQAVTITFNPGFLSNYEYLLTLSYEFRSFNGVIKGTGGCAILTIESPLRMVEFGTCRLNRQFRKSLAICNTGNLGVNYYVRPEPPDRDWSVYDVDVRGSVRSRPTTSKVARSATGRRQSRVIVPSRSSSASQPVSTVADAPSTNDLPLWAQRLEDLGFSLPNASGYCTPHGKTELVVNFRPNKEALVSARLRVYFGEQYEDIDLRGRAAVPRLALYTAANEQIGSEGYPLTYDIGVHPVNSEHIHILHLVNEGQFGIDFLMQPISIREFDVQPLRGYIEPESSIPLKVFFRPQSESEFQARLKVLWEREPIEVRISGKGGIGKLEILYTEDKDIAWGGLDFGMLPFQTAAEKSFIVFNTGMVEIIVSAEVENEEFTIAQIGDPFPMATRVAGGPLVIAAAQKAGPKRTVWNWYSTLRMLLPPGMGLEVGAKFFARSPSTSVDSIMLQCECGSFPIPMRGKGGTIQVSHRGDLSFGDIASNFTHTRTLALTNSGSIPATLTAEWLIVGHSSESSSAMVKLNEVYSAMDPRSGWAKTQFFKDNGITDPTVSLSAKDRWSLIALLVKKSDNTDDAASSMHLGKLWGSTVTKIRSAIPRGESIIGSIASISDANSASLSSTLLYGGERGKLASSGSTMHKKGMPAQYSAQFKRRQMFFHLITNTAITSQSLPMTKPYVKVSPGTIQLPSFGEVAFQVEVNLSTEDTFLGTLVLKPNVLNTPSHEIPLTATPKAVKIICDDTRTLDFFRQPLGEAETLTRTFTNIGHKDIQFTISNPNPGLTIEPQRGTLRVGETIKVAFIFCPVEEALQTGDVRFEPDCSQPIRLKMYGGGGYAKSSLSKYRRFDFGHCMIGKDTVSFLPITNEGNAMLHMTRFDLAETDTFFRGIDWPTSRVSLFPGKSYNLPIVFNPHEESPAPGRLTVATVSRTWEIELVGLGREAVLIVQQVALQFAQCLIGNCYLQKIELKNVGDVNYPVTCKLERDFPDLEFYPASVVIDPFSDASVTVSYAPSKETRTTVVVTISSPYSTHKVPMQLHAGTATLEFSSTTLEMGMFERTTSPSVTLEVTNTGTVRTNFSVRDVVKPSMFKITGGKGLIHPGKTAAVVITHVRHEVCQFREKLIVRTDLIDSPYYIHVTGQCEEAMLKPDEFNVVNLGICPVLETTTKPLTFKNHGRYPLEYMIKSAYPMKVLPPSGSVAGGDSGTIQISWNPSGGYELRTQITMATNIGNYTILVRGKAAFPELVLKNVYLDFGVCAVGHTYKETFNMANKGKVPIGWTIPPVREASYAVSQSDGVLQPKESLDVDVYFRPISVGKYANTLMVECKGINYKEVAVIGIGGLLKLDILPSILDIVTLQNHGDVTIFADFAEEPADDSGSTCSVTVPLSKVIKPGRSARCLFGVLTKTIGPFRTRLQLTTKEKTYYIPVFGVGVKIVLTERSRHILQSEHLPSLTAPGPLAREITVGDFEDCLRRLRRNFQLDCSIVEMLTGLLICSRTHIAPRVATIDRWTPSQALPTSRSLGWFEDNDEDDVEDEQEMQKSAGNFAVMVAVNVDGSGVEGVLDVGARDLVKEIAGGERVRQSSASDFSTMGTTPSAPGNEGDGSTIVQPPRKISAPPSGQGTSEIGLISGGDFGSGGELEGPDGFNFTEAMSSTEAARLSMSMKSIESSRGDEISVGGTPPSADVPSDSLQLEGEPAHSWTAGGIEASPSVSAGRAVADEHYMESQTRERLQPERLQRSSEQKSETAPLSSSAEGGAGLVRSGPEAALGMRTEFESGMTSSSTYASPASAPDVFPETGSSKETEGVIPAHDAAASSISAMEAIAVHGSSSTAPSQTPAEVLSGTGDDRSNKEASPALEDVALHTSSTALSQPPAEVFTGTLDDRLKTEASPTLEDVAIQTSSAALSQTPAEVLTGTGDYRLNTELSPPLEDVVLYTSSPAPSQTPADVLSGTGGDGRNTDVMPALEDVALHRSSMVPSKTPAEVLSGTGDDRRKSELLPALEDVVRNTSSTAPWQTPEEVELTARSENLAEGATIEISAAMIVQGEDPEFNATAVEPLRNESGRSRTPGGAIQIPSVRLESDGSGGSAEETTSSAEVPLSPVPDPAPSAPPQLIDLVNMHPMASIPHSVLELAAEEKTSFAAAQTALEKQWEMEGFRKRLRLLVKLEKARKKSKAPELDEAHKLVESFMEIKDEEFSRQPPPVRDPIIHNILRGNIQISNLDLDPILIAEELEPDLDIAILTERPAPFGRQDESEQESATVTTAKGSHRSTQFDVFPPLKKSQRNAHTVDSFRYRERRLRWSGMPLYYANANPQL
ncbi:hypothetical protein BDK51DRAFT_29030 [Blyttiomyces helicus]|uniref:HYDIN/VesB/CFA65-like Ig-like domain-containing protein n=1 Tax=Blyttiomyces helicus TaxID=388810 RepID=A0A4P9WR31_9FUNG|nr:hypothetical protein BDK51DRAFT_29030 [Blyttiomyces helicus]|eukprot:RKO94673.1 hypothetical protein BDK51DRAFT_29030 [Blyttiomyces helicus]